MRQKKYFGYNELGDISRSLKAVKYARRGNTTGEIECFITGKLRKDTPEERVRQDVARRLVEEYGYEEGDVNIEFPIKMGKNKKRADIVIFSENGKHVQENIYIIAEIKSTDIKPSDRKEGIGQLKSYVAACPNSLFALWLGNESLAFKVVEGKGKRILLQVPDVPKRGEKLPFRNPQGTRLFLL